jgi:hypothetical protein
VDELCGRQVGHVPENGELVGGLPEQVGQEDEQGKPRGEVEIFLGKNAAVLREQQSRQHGEEEDEHGVFIEQTQPGGSAEPQQPPLVFGVDVFQKKPAQQRPVKDVEHDGHEQHARPQVRPADQACNANEGDGVFS